VKAKTFLPLRSHATLSADLQLGSWRKSIQSAAVFFKNLLEYCRIRTVFPGERLVCPGTLREASRWRAGSRSRQLPTVRRKKAVQGEGTVVQEGETEVQAEGIVVSEEEKVVVGGRKK
jgi:hypothetical protein